MLTVRLGPWGSRDGHPPAAESTDQAVPRGAEGPEHGGMAARGNGWTPLSHCRFERDATAPRSAPALQRGLVRRSHRVRRGCAAFSVCIRGGDIATFYTIEWYS